MAQNKIQNWGSHTHEQCVHAIDPCDSFLRLYKKQFRKSSKRMRIIENDDDLQEILDLDDFKNKDMDGNIAYPKHIDFRLKTMNIMNPMINDILYDDTLWHKHFRYKHKNKQYLEKARHESFRMWYENIIHNNIHQIPQKKQRNKICLVSITDDQTYFIDEELIKSLEELIEIYFGLKIKHIDVSNTNNVFHNKEFRTKNIHHKLSTYYNNDKEIFAIIGICYKIGILNGENKVIHGEHDSNIQSAVTSFSKLGVYHKREKNIPQWLKIRRSAKILFHEIAHLFGLSHCEYFRCLMNKDVVLDCVPMILCPICLSKLYYAMVKQNNHRNTFEYDIKDSDLIENDSADSIKGGTDEEKERKRMRRKRMRIDPNTFNLYQRYRDLATWFNKHKLFREATWYKNRINAINATL